MQISQSLGSTRFRLTLLNVVRIDFVIAFYVTLRAPFINNRREHFLCPGVKRANR